MHRYMRYPPLEKSLAKARLTVHFGDGYFRR